MNTDPLVGGRGNRLLIFVRFSGVLRHPTFENSDLPGGAKRCFSRGEVYPKPHGSHAIKDVLTAGSLHFSSPLWGFFISLPRRESNFEMACSCDFRISEGGRGTQFIKDSRPRLIDIFFAALQLSIDLICPKGLYFRR